MFPSGHFLAMVITTLCLKTSTKNAQNRNSVLYVLKIIIINRRRACFERRGDRVSVETFRKKALLVVQSDPKLKKVIPEHRQKMFVQDMVEWYHKNRKPLTRKVLQKLMQRHCKHKWNEVSRHGSGKTLGIKQKCPYCEMEQEVMPNLLGDFFSIPVKR